MLNTFLFNLAGLLPDFVTIPLLETLLEFRDRRAFRISCAAMFVLFRALRCIFGSRIGVLSLPALLLICMAFGEGTLSSRVVGYLVCVAYINFVQMIPTVIWVLVSGVNLDDIAENVLEYPMYFVFTLVIATTVYASKSLLGMMRSYVETRSVSISEDPGIILLVMQLFWVFPLSANGLAFQTNDPTVALLIGLCHTASFVAATLLLDDVNAAVTVQREEIRAATISKVAEGYERHYRELDAHITRAAELRHDFRNIMQLVEGLVQSGQSDAAHQVVEEGLLSGLEPIGIDHAGASDGSAGESEVPEPRYSEARMRVRLVLYPIVGIICTYLLVMVISDTSAGLGAKVLSAAVALLWLVLIPVFVRLMHLAQRAEIARVRSAAAQELLDARVFYNGQIMRELQQAEQIESDLRSRLESMRSMLEEDPAGAHVSLGMIEGGLNGSVRTVRRRFCENTTLDTLLFLKASACEELGVSFSCSASVPRELGLGKLELCSMFGNVLDNALSACEALPEGERWIELSAEVRSRWLVVVVCNSCRANAPQLGGSAARRRARVGDEHGWGTRILSELASSHGGYATFAQEDGVFTTTLMVSAE